MAQPETLKPVTRAEWIAALRSGAYKQGRDSLKRGDRFCCLGVACDLAGFNWRRLPPAQRAVAAFRDIDASGALNRSLGVDGDVTHRLAIMNDYDKKTFAEIADYIETLP